MLRVLAAVTIAGLMLGACSEKTQDQAAATVNHASDAAVSAAHDAEANGKVAAAEATVAGDKAARKAKAAERAAEHTN